LVKPMTPIVGKMATKKINQPVKGRFVKRKREQQNGNQNTGCWRYRPKPSDLISRKVSEGVMRRQIDRPDYFIK